MLFLSTASASTLAFTPLHAKTALKPGNEASKPHDIIATFNNGIM